MGVFDFKLARDWRCNEQALKTSLSVQLEPHAAATCEDGRPVQKAIKSELSVSCVSCGKPRLKVHQPEVTDRNPVSFPHLFQSHALL